MTGASPPSISFQAPAFNDSYLLSETSIAIQWLSCNIGIYPHLVSLELWNNANTPQRVLILETSLEDTGIQLFLINI